MLCVCVLLVALVVAMLYQSVYINSYFDGLV